MSNAQIKEDFKKGWILNKSVKTEGYIKTDDLSKLSVSLCFKKDLEETGCKMYNNTQIKSFQIGSDIFDLLDLRINKNQKKISLFGNLILKGEKLSLYKSIYDSEKIYILSKGNKNYTLQNDKLFSGDSKITKYNYQGILNFVTEGLISKVNLKTKYSEDTFIDIVTKYNQLKNASSKDLRVKEKSTNYFLANAGVGVKNSNSEYYGQVMYRKYYPKISRNVSINIGVSYFNYQLKSENEKYTQSLLSIPFQAQHNILNKKIRPNIFAGFSLNYLRITDNENNSLAEEGFQKTYGLNFLFGVGIEIDLLKGIYLKGEYRNEAYSHPILFGIGYIFSK